MGSTFCLALEITGLIEPRRAFRRARAHVFTIFEHRNVLSGQSGCFLHYLRHPGWHAALQGSVSFLWTVDVVQKRLLRQWTAFMVVSLCVLHDEREWYFSARKWSMAVQSHAPVHLWISVTVWVSLVC